MKALKRTYLLIVLSLLFISLVVVFSASGYFASKHSSMYAYFYSHSAKVGLSILMIFILGMIPYDFFREFSKWLLVGIIFILILTLMFAPQVKGAARWLNIGIIRFQPSELAKLLLIIHLANLIERKGEKITNFNDGLIYALFWVFVIFILVFFQPNISLSIIVIICSTVLLYVGGAKFKHLFYTFSPGVLLAGIYAMFSGEHHYSKGRIFSYINSLITGKSINHQVLQAKIALGSGGLFGLGLGQSHQSAGFVPEAYGDFIFSIIGEEFGFVGIMLILLAYLALFIIGIMIAKRTADKFAQLLVFGISFNIALSAFVNASVVTGLLPTTGITLPFVSYGGTSLMVFGMSVGIVLNVASSLSNKAQVQLV